MTVTDFQILNRSAVPPFTIQDDTDGGDDLRMKYRYLDLRRNAVKKNLELRYAVNRATRDYLHQQGFMDIETPFLIKSTPEGARDFVVPSRMNPGQFYALPQSPQTFKQLLMVSGYDRYYQIVKCFRDEDLRADRQPEFTQIDCEMAFVEQEDILDMFEGLVKYIFKQVKGKFIKSYTYNPKQKEKNITPRQNDIARLILKGFSNQEIADYLSVSVFTVKNHKKLLFRKVNAKNSMDFANYVRQTL